MTLSNFDWTDKNSVKWFILLPTGHEGPYSLNRLITKHNQQKVALDLKIWAEGLSEGIPLKKAINYSNNGFEDEVPELPPLPLEEQIPPVPVAEESPDIPKPSKVIWPYVGLVVIISSIIFFTISGIVNNHENFSLNRQPKMSVALHDRIVKENSFSGWDKKIFFKEYLPTDHTLIWLVTTGHQTCQVEAQFSSISGKMLTMDQDKVVFKASGTLKNHLTEFSSFDFSSGNKIVPGMYEMDVKATNCEWDGFLPKLMNWFSAPDESYVARTKVILFSKGPKEYNSILDRLLKKKEEVFIKEQSRKEIFWQNLQQKFETLQAITLQIEQLILDFLETDHNNFQKKLRPMVDQYTRKFGSFFTTFVVENENDFKKWESEEAGSSQKRNYELMVKLTSKKIGFESMKFIEEFQSIKGRPTAKQLAQLNLDVKKRYSEIKNDINQKIIQVSEDRSK